MIDKCLCKKASREAAFLCFILIGISSVFASVANPDFAYPKTVAANAGVELDKSVKQGDGQQALKSCIELCISSTLVSQDNYMQGIEALDKVKKLHSPWKNLGYLLEARMLRDIYMSDKGVYDNRVMDINTDISQVKQWNGKSFTLVIDSLLAIAYPPNVSYLQTPLSQMGSVITNTDDAIACNATVADFIAMQVLDLRNELGLKDSAQPLQKQIELASANGNKALEAYLSYYLCNNSVGENKVLTECLQKFADTRYYAPFLLQKEFNDNAVKYSELNGYLDKYPNCWQHAMLENVIASLLSKSVNYQTKKQVTTSMKPEVSVECTNYDRLNFLIVKVPDSYIAKNISYSEIVKFGKIAQSKEIIFNAKPAQKKDTIISFAPLAQGVYTIIASNNETLSGIIKDKNTNSKSATSLVSDITCFKVSDYGKGKYGKLYVVRGSNQNPVKDAKVTLTSRNTKVPSVNLKTGSDGSVVLPKGSWTATIVKGKDRVVYEIWNTERYSDQNPKTNVLAQVLCDKSVCHPGDSVQFVTVVYSKENKNFNLISDKDIKAVLINANWQRIDSLQLRSDLSGRAEASFCIPKNGLLGTYHIQIEEVDKGNHKIGNANIDVAEYKTPSFLVSAQIDGPKNTENAYSPNEKINIAGLVKTYSGAPESGAVVRYVITDVPYRFYYYRNNNARIAGSVTCGSNGGFNISVDPDSLSGNQNPIGLYNMEIIATSQSGESVSASPLKFAIGNDYSISANIPDKYLVENINPKFKVSVHNQLGLTVKKPVYYRITQNEELISSGVITDSEFSPEFKKMKSGKYQILLSLSKKFDSDDEKLLKKDIIIYRADDKVPPFETSLWVPDTKIVSQKSEKTVEIQFGNSYKDASVFVQISDCSGIISNRWIKSSGEMEKLSVDVLSADSRIYVNLTSLHNLVQKSATITIVPYQQTEELEIVTETFRDHITPNAQEQWKFKFNIAGKPMGNVAAMAVMTDKALNTISPLNWSMSPRQGVYYPNWNQIYYNDIYDSYWNLYLRNNKTVDAKPIVFPDWELYGYSLYTGMRYGVVRSYNGAMLMKESANMVYASAPSADGLMMQKSAATEDLNDTIDEVAVETSEVVATTGAKANETEQLRMAECPVAFFKPLLTTDENGNLTIDFTSPDFNGTWQFQLLGYTDDLRTAKITKDIIANKPLMATINYPQFLRTGDQPVITTTVYNLTNKDIKADATLEFFNPLNGDVVSTKKLTEVKISADGQYVMSVQCDLVTDLDLLGIRVMASDGKNRDGEQYIFPIFPASQPVVDSETFYYSPSDQDIHIAIPQAYSDAAKHDGKVTLQFCNNPVWECVKALPVVAESEGKSEFNSLTLAAKIFSTSVALNIMDRYPQVGEALKYFADENAKGGTSLTSNLSKNNELTISELNATPWVIDAQSQTLRMSQLQNYMDKGKLNASLASCSLSLKGLQNEDGGWLWCKGMESSPYITTRVLEYFAQANQLGCFPTEMVDMVDKAISYYESYIQKEVARYNKKNGRYPYINFLNFYYSLTRLNNLGIKSTTGNILAQLLKDINSGWKKYGIEQKCKFAWLLDNNGYKMKAREIVESLRQYATIEKGRGMWYDNMRETGAAPLMLTGMVIQTINKIEPESEDIDLMRQWLLLNKQSNDWGNSVGSSVAVEAILSTGSNWTGNGGDGIQIYIDGRQQNVSSVEGYTGSVMMNIGADNREIVIKRNSATPGWGGLIAQSVKPIKDIQKSNNKDLEIKKEVVVIATNGEARKVELDNAQTELKVGDKNSVEPELKVGDKVRVNLIVKCNKEIDYLTVQDTFAAGFTPIDKLSGYRAENGVYMYREIGKDSVTLYIQHLAKGTWVLSYDCMLTHAGLYTAGLALAQSLYASSLSAHTPGSTISIR